MPGTELPGMRAFETMMTAPADMLNLATRQVGETASMLNMGVTRTLDTLDLPGLPPVAQLLPMGIGAQAAPPAKKVTNGQMAMPVRTAAYGEE